ncbi:hypothetical protein [Vibrio crassostreae]|uniref:hypothetical protein n=1 Tax=Vibrio crassostreae TaxID=246167 RepID=UPI001B304F1B|nr:hypothetical protein [Vibrio crassostreae]
MGYTHYTYKGENLTDAQKTEVITKIKKVVDYIIRNKPTKFSTRYFEGEELELFNGRGEVKLLHSGDSVIHVTDSNDPEYGDVIVFNGDRAKDFDHETFVLALGDNVPHGDFNFCKTDRKPYDAAVVAALLIVNSVNEKAFKVSSDGYQEDWEAGRKLVATALGEVVPFPPLVLMNPVRIEEARKAKAKAELEYALSYIPEIDANVRRAVAQADGKPLKIHNAVEKAISQLPRGKARAHARKCAQLALSNGYLKESAQR